MTGMMDARLSARPPQKRTRITTLMAPLAAVAFAPVFVAPAHAITVLEQGWQIANSKCKDGDDKQCVLRDQLSARLKRNGCAFQEDGGWWKCTRTR
jgi:hypothetical protein